jgi:hypothetical protein
MFVNKCTSCEKRLLIFPSQITGMARIAGVTACTYTCWCGAEQLWHSDMEAGAAEAKPTLVAA